MKKSSKYASSLMVELGKEVGVPAYKLRQLYSLWQDEVVKALNDGYYVTFPELFTIRVVDRKPRRQYDVKSGTTVQLPQRKALKATFSAKLKEKIK